MDQNDYFFNGGFRREEMRDPLAMPRPTRYRATLRCPCGEIGRRIRLKIERRKACWFESGQGHHSWLTKVDAAHQQDGRSPGRIKIYGRNASG